MNSLILDGHTYELFPISTPDFLVSHDIPYPIKPRKMYRESLSTVGFYQPTLYLYDSISINGQWYGYYCLSSFDGKEYFSATSIVEKDLLSAK